MALPVERDKALLLASSEKLLENSMPVVAAERGVAKAERGVAEMAPTQPENRELKILAAAVAVVITEAAAKAAPAS